MSVEKTLKVWTLLGLKNVPVEFQTAELCVTDGVGRVLRVQRVSLHDDVHGRKLIVLHDTTITPLVALS